MGFTLSLDAFSVNLKKKPIFLDEDVSSKWSIGNFEIKLEQESNNGGENSLSYCGCWVVQKGLNFDTKTSIENIDKYLLKLTNMI